MPPPPPPSSATAPTRSASAVSFQASSASQDASTSIDTRASDEEEEDFGGADDTFASFDARNNTMALLAEDDGIHDGCCVVASLEATANTYSPDVLDRLVDTLVGTCTPNFAKDMERSFAEFDEKTLMAYSGNAVLDDTANTDANADTSTETANTSTNNDAPEALRFRKIAEAGSFPYDDVCEEKEEEEEENISNVAVRRFFKCLPFSISSKKSDGTNDTATKNVRSNLVKAGEDILIHNETGPVSCGSTNGSSLSHTVLSRLLKKKKSQRQASPKRDGSRAGHSKVRMRMRPIYKL